MTKRKRKSFYMPEAPEVEAWFNAQGDVSLSLQVVILKAVEQYGTTDVVGAFMREQMIGGVKLDVDASDKFKADTREAVKAKVTPKAQVKKTENKTQPKQKTVKPEAPKETKAKTESKLPDPDNVSDADLDWLPDLNAVPPTNNDSDDKDNDKEATKKEIPQTETSSDDSDDLSIMFGDVGSSLKQ